MYKVWGFFDIKDSWVALPVIYLNEPGLIAHFWLSFLQLRQWNSSYEFYYFLLFCGECLWTWFDTMLNWLTTLRKHDKLNVWILSWFEGGLSYCCLGFVNKSFSCPVIAVFMFGFTCVRDCMVYIRIHHFFPSFSGWSRTWGEEHFGNGYGRLTLKLLYECSKASLMIASSFTMICLFFFFWI